MAEFLTPSKKRMAVPVKLTDGIADAVLQVINCFKLEITKTLGYATFNLMQIQNWRRRQQHPFKVLFFSKQPI